MRAMNPGYNSAENLNRRAVQYLGKNVRDTSEREGIARHYYVKGGVIHLLVESSNGSTFWTDNEHAHMM